MILGTYVLKTRPEFDYLLSL